MIITDINQIEVCKKKNITNFLFPLKNFCVGYPKTFSLEEIAEGYLFINRILDTEAYLALKDLLKELSSSIKGIVFEDFGMITLAKELHLKQKLILYQTHFLTNNKSINEHLAFVDSLVIGTDITKEETSEILTKTQKPLVLFTYGLVPAMYSRRTLLSNYEKEFNLSKKTIANIREQTTKKGFIVVENEYGTVLYHENYVVNQMKIEEENILFHLINPLFLTEEELEDVLEDLLKGKARHGEKEDQGFLNTKTIYRLKGDENE